MSPMDVWWVSGLSAAAQSWCLRGRRVYVVLGARWPDRNSPGAVRGQWRVRWLASSTGWNYHQASWDPADTYERVLSYYSTPPYVGQFRCHWIAWQHLGSSHSRCDNQMLCFERAHTLQESVLLCILLFVCPYSCFIDTSCEYRSPVSKHRQVDFWGGESYEGGFVATKIQLAMKQTARFANNSMQR